MVKGELGSTACCGTCELRHGVVMMGIISAAMHLIHVCIISSLYISDNYHTALGKPWIRGLIITTLSIASLSILVDIIFVVGAAKKQINIVLFWLIYTGITFCINVTVLGILWDKWMFSPLLVEIFLTGTSIYIFKVVRRYWSRLKDGEDSSESSEVEA